MAPSHKPVFLSYASQDAQAAGRIAEALREAGLEVWFDQSALRGGDAWDSLIRRQVKECALFVPVISANTESRSEGYFRLEWKLAVDRSYLMADDQAFLLPIVVDDTHEACARVPDGFRSRQWTRLPEGHGTPEFVAHVRHLLEHAPGPAATPVSHAATQRKPAAAPASNRKGVVIAGALAAVAIVLLVVLLLRPAREPPPQAPSLPPQVAEAAPTKAAEEPRPAAAAVAAPAQPPAPQPRKEERRKPPVSVAKIDLLQPAVAHESDIQPIRLVSNTPIGAPQESAVWHVQVELAFWETIKASTMVEDFEEYLKQYPDGKFAGLAKNRVRALKKAKK